MAAFALVAAGVGWKMGKEVTKAVSGGSHGYICYRIEEELVGQMEDYELNDLMKDVQELAHDLEWYHSGDTSEDTYKDTVRKFKEKWFQGDREKRLIGYIDEEISKLRSELYGLIGE